MSLELNNFKRAASFDDLAIVLPKWERKVRDLEHFPRSGVTDEVKMDFLLKIIPTRLQQFTSALISTGGHNWEMLRYFVDSQVAKYRTAKTYDGGSKFDSKEPSRMIIGEVYTEQATENTKKLNAVPNSGAERDPWKDWKDDGTSEGFDGGGMCRTGKGGMATLGPLPQDVRARQDCLRGKERDQCSKWSGNGGKGWDHGKGFGNQSRKCWQLSGNGSYGKGFRKKDLNEMGVGLGRRVGHKRDPSADRRARFHTQMECHAGAQANLLVGRPLEPDPSAEQVQRVPGDGR